MKKNIILLPIYFSIIIFSVSCSNNKQSNFRFKSEPIPLTLNIEGKKHIFNELIVPYKIHFENNLLIVGEGRRNSPKNAPIHLIDKKNWTYLHSKGISGFGPGEISDVSGIESGFNDRSFWTYSMMSKNFSEFDITDSSMLAEKQIKQEESFFMAIHLTWHTDSTVVCRLANDEFRFVIFHIDGTRLKSFGKWSDILERNDFNNFLMSDLHSGYLKGNPNKGIFAVGNFYRDRLEILNLNKGNVITVDGPFNQSPKFEIMGGKGQSQSIVIDWDEPLAFLDIYVGNEFIYTLYSGQTEKKINQTAEVAKTIFVYNFEGIILARLDLDTSINAFCVDEKVQKIYGITTDKEPGIAEFNIPLTRIESLKDNKK
jgi:hypothetical protein